MTDRRAQCAEKPCCRCGYPPPSAVHHVTLDRGLSQRAPDDQVLPLCGQCHVEFHSATGAFKGWDRERRREWQRSRLASVWTTEDVF
jgi:5-methylcytosine-specific restriction endonuclease McrA